MLTAMPSSTAKPLRVSLVGPGRVGAALALNLLRAGYEVQFLTLPPRDGASTKSVKLTRRVTAKVVAAGQTPLDSDLVWITVPDDAIASVAAQLAQAYHWRGKVAFHSSGALTSDALSPLRDRGAKVASVHPGMTFVRQSLPRMEGVPFGVEGDPSAVRLAKDIVRDLGGTTHLIAKPNKALYHAFGSFASPMLIALMTALEQVGSAAGIKQSDLRTMAKPLLQQTLKNYLEHGAAAAFSGPLVRGDVATVRRHLQALRAVPNAREAYIALARMVVTELPVKNRKAMQKELAGGRNSRAGR